MSDKHKNNISRQSSSGNKRVDLNVSLNDAAALLIQLEPNDFSELARLQEILNTIAGDRSCPESSREKIIRVAQKIEASVSDFIPMESDMMADIGHLIEDTMNSVEEDGKTDHASVAAVQKQNDQPLPETEPESANESSEQSEIALIPTDADPDLLSAFITESAELITNAEEALLSLETDPDDMEAVSTVFRAFHTVKGTSAFLELSLISEMAHRSESFLSRIRDREIHYAGGYTDLALRSIDMLKELIQSLTEAMKGKPFFRPRGYDELMRFLADPEQAGISAETAEPPAVIPRIGDILVAQGKAERQKVEEAAASEAKKPIGEKIVSSKTASLIDVAKGLRTQQRMGQQVIESSVRVPIERLDRFIDTVGELVVAHSMVAQDEVVGQGEHHELFKKVAHTTKIVRELQNMSMSMRMIPLRGTFRKITRLVRDLARKAGKNVTLITEGEDTEIDRNMVDIINDPLVHMVRNAVDHGIEPPEVREKIGKHPSGVLKLSARHSAGNVVVEIKDDGRGLNREAILAKALENELISEAVVRDSTLGDQDVFSLIFEPGFSTAKFVSEISGRGVGMDVVKKNIEALRGQIEIQSAPGEGSLFKMSLPLTLAIIDGMVVRVGSEKYVVPTVSIVRSVRPDPKDLSTVLSKGETLTLQGKLIPLFRLARLFGVEGAEDDPTRAIVMVVEDSGKQTGLLVDELIGSQQIVIKTLGETMRNIPGISGSAIMPNGRVGLILDIGGLVKLANSVN
ncbi:chemotaxis protein CheA [Desulfonema magnum]|uniref:Chemotaxis protein CheA n=1 Tax=Desulfonema magnum TaxID=45655 RepID=A0A975BHF2_9BACT|nr:chemotaxis protein CheA [Desulfonema magnum]QTA85269.1 Two component system histidine kinase, CheA and CheW domains-containing [Desulfonema magnum]